jgi:hypothetical protein
VTSQGEEEQLISMEVEQYPTLFPGFYGGTDDSFREALLGYPTKHRYSEDLAKIALRKKEKEDEEARCQRILLSQITTQHKVEHRKESRKRSNTNQWKKKEEDGNWLINPMEHCVYATEWVSITPCNMFTYLENRKANFKGLPTVDPKLLNSTRSEDYF